MNHEMTKTLTVNIGKTRQEAWIISKLSNQPLCNQEFIFKARLPVWCVAQSPCPPPGCLHSLLCWQASPNSVLLYINRDIIWKHHVVYPPTLTPSSAPQASATSPNSLPACKATHNLNFHFCLWETTHPYWLAQSPLTYLPVFTDTSSLSVHGYHPQLAISTLPITVQHLLRVCSHFMKPSLPSPSKEYPSPWPLIYLSIYALYILPCIFSYFILFYLVLSFGVCYFSKSRL